MFDLRAKSDDVMIRRRLAPSDARYAGGLIAGSTAMEIFADLETEIALREGSDEGLCASYDSVEFKTPLRVGDFVEGVAHVIHRGKTSRQIAAHLYRVASVDDRGVLIEQSAPELAATAVATIVVGQTQRAAAQP